MKLNIILEGWPPNHHDRANLIKADLSSNKFSISDIAIRHSVSRSRVARIARSLGYKPSVGGSERGHKGGDLNSRHWPWGVLYSV